MSIHQPWPEDQSITEAILQSISDGVFTVDQQWQITSFNRAAEKITKVPKKEALGRLCSEVLRSSLCEQGCPLKLTLRTGQPCIEKNAFIIDALGNKIPISLSTAVLKNRAGEIIGGAETFRDLSEITILRQELKSSYQVGDLISRSPKMQKIFKILPAIANSESTVLILGETGTGKEVLARTIHQLSNRKHGPFLAVNCGALPDNLLESELFGYKAGAFTGADKDKPGRFALAKTGTLFLDEIGEITPALQVRLLRVLETKYFEPLGATCPEKANVRLIAATNKDLKKMTEQGKFRQDLYYRLNVVKLELPPLRERKEDLPLLLEQLIAKFNKLQQKNIQGLTSQAMAILLGHNWPGNIRELANVIEWAFIVCDQELIQVHHLPDELTACCQLSSKHTTEENNDLQSAKTALEIQKIKQALEDADYNCTKAAQTLGIHRSTLYRKLRRLGISLPQNLTRNE